MQYRPGTKSWISEKWKERRFAHGRFAECPFCRRKQSVKSKKCTGRRGGGCGADLEKARRSGRIKYWIALSLPGGRQRFEKITGENATSIEYARAADAKRTVQKRENRILDITPEAKMTFRELTD